MHLSVHLSLSSFYFGTSPQGMVLQSLDSNVGSHVRGRREKDVGSHVRGRREKEREQERGDVGQEGGLVGA